MPFEAAIRAALRKALGPIGPERPQIAAVYLFGSSLRAEPKERSDVDLAFLLDRRAYREDPLAAVTPAYLAATEVGMAVQRQTDVLILNSASLEMAHQAVTNGRCLFERSVEERLDYEIALRGMYLDFMPYLEQLRAGRREAAIRRAEHEIPG